MPAPALKAKIGLGHPRAQDIDRYVGARMRERRVVLGLTQQQLAKLIGVTYQQAHKYEKGTNRVAAGRLFTIAEALSVEVGYFYEGFDSKGSFQPTQQQRAFLELTRHFAGLPSRKQQVAICDLARVMADPMLGPNNDIADRRPRDTGAS